MTWRDMTIPELLGRRATPRRSPVGLGQAVPGERVMDLFRLIMHVSLVSILTVALALPVVTLIAGAAAGSRHIARVRAGRRARPWPVIISELVRMLAGSWPIGLAAAGLGALGYLNLTFLVTQPTLFSAALLALNVSGLLLGLLWLTACVHELADDPGLRGREVLARATRRAAVLRWWHVAVLAGAVVTAALFLIAPPAALLIGPGLTLLLTRIPDSPPSRPERQPCTT